VALREGRKALPSDLIVDAQSVKNTDTARQKGYDAGKKISGIKRHLLEDPQGLVHRAEVTAANVTDRQGTLLALQGSKQSPGNGKALPADGRL